jgi:drug/metabolite transporter (DMT)-like permease
MAGFAAGLATGIALNPASASASPAYRLIGVALAIFSAVFFSFKSILIKLAYGYQVDPVTLITLRMLFSLPVFIAVGIRSQRDSTLAPVSKRDAMAVLALGFSGYYVSSYLDFMSLQYVSASLERLILFLYPTMVLLISVLILKKRASRRELVALAFSYAGIVLVFMNDLSSGITNRNLTLGGALVFGSALLYALYLISSTDTISRIGSARFAAYAMTVACMCVIVQFLLLHPLSALVLPWQVYAYGAAIALFSTVLPIFMVSEALRRIGAMKVSMLGALGPIATIFGDVLIMNAPLSFLQVAGSIMVLAGVWIISTQAKKTA